jgi:uncharacterized protein
MSGQTEPNRLERLRASIDDMIRELPDAVESRCAFVHLYGVAAICALLAHRRGLDPELCATAGMLHDVMAHIICAYGRDGLAEHGKLGAIEAEKLLRKSGGYANDEIASICNAIANHSDKAAIDDDLSELLKDADCLQHHLYNPSLPVAESRKDRLRKALAELGMDMECASSLAL